MNGRSLPHEDERLVVEKAGGGRKRPRRSRSRGPPRDREFRGGRSDVCYNCNKEGHFARDCKEESSRGRRERGDEPRGADGRCFICDEKGHKKIDCPNRRGGGGGRGNYKDRSGSVSRSPPRKRSRTPRSRSRSYKR